MADYDDLAEMASDDVLGRVDNIFEMLLDDIERVIKTGTVQNRILLAKTIIPALVKERANRRGGGNEMQRKEFTDMMKDLRASIYDPSATVVQR